MHADRRRRDECRGSLLDHPCSSGFICGYPFVPMNDLFSDVRRLDGKPYPAYRDLRGRRYSVGNVALCLEHVQGDPFAAPSRLRVDVGGAAAGLPELARADRDARRAAADFVHRALRFALRADQRAAGGGRRAGSGKSGIVEIAALGQEVLERTAVRVDDDGSLVVRLAVGLPAAGRRILGAAAAELLAVTVPGAVSETLGTLDGEALRRHVEAVEDQVALRAALADRGLIAFVADGSVLPRRSGAADEPMDGAVAFAAPPSLRVELTAPHRGAVGGLGVRAGVTLVAGGGYHGKSTLLQTLARGVYDHVPGDGRELCVSAADTVQVRAEDGRSVRGVDLRPFIGNLPLGRSTQAFDSDDASGSTSQAAAIVEAMEAGATLLLIDEDTAATNFMIRDSRMRALVPADKEPITPFLDRVRQLYDDFAVSTVLVAGGAGDYLDVADAVVRMDEYRPRDATATARGIAAAMPLGAAAPRSPAAWPAPRPRVPERGCLDPARGRRAERVRAVRTTVIEFGREEIDVSLLSQLVDPGQCRMIGDVLLEWSRRLCDGETTIAAALDAIERRIDESGIECVTAPTFGDRARARRHEIAAALNRCRALRIEGQ
jgi:predicted ABC-class ATPase